MQHVFLMYIHESLWVGCMKPPFSNTLRPPAVTDTLATITVLVLLLFCVCKCVLWISCSVLPAEAFSVSSGNPAPQRCHSTETRGLARKHQPDLRFNICISHHPAALPQLWSKLFRASLKSELVYIFRSYILRYAKRKEGQRGFGPEGPPLASVCLLCACWDPAVSIWHYYTVLQTAGRGKNMEKEEKKWHLILERIYISQMWALLF